MTENSDKNSADSFEEALEALQKRQKKESRLKPVLYLIVIAASIWFLYGWWADISYFFEPNTPEKIGEITKLATEEKSVSLMKYHNRFVELGGIPLRRSQSKNYRFFKLVGADVYVQTPREKQSKSKSSDTSKKSPANFPMRATDRVRFSGEGRLLAFSRASGAVAGIQQYYEKNYGTTFCETTNRSDKCSQGFIFKHGVTPSSHWWYLLIAAGLIAFALLNLYWLISSLQDR